MTVGFSIGITSWVNCAEFGSSLRPAPLMQTLNGNMLNDIRLGASTEYRVGVCANSSRPLRGAIDSGIIVVISLASLIPRFFPSTPAKIKPARWITESLNRVISKGVFFLQTLTLCLHRNVFVPKRSNVNWWYRTLLSWLWLGWWMSRSYQPGKPVSFSWLTSVWLNENLTHFLFFLSSSIWLELG